MQGKLSSLANIRNSISVRAHSLMATVIIALKGLNAVNKIYNEGKYCDVKNFESQLCKYLRVKITKSHKVVSLRGHEQLSF